MKKYGVIVAMNHELVPITENFKDYKVIGEKCGFKFLEVNYNNNIIILTDCGVGKTNATMAAQIMIDTYGVEALISTGVAGGLSDKLHSFDIVIATTAKFHDIDAYFLDKYQPHCSEFIAESNMLTIARKAAPDAFCGLIVSGDVYVSTTEERNRIIEKYNPLACDMESASIGLCAYRNGIPFLSVRSISDNADEETTANPEEFEKIAAKQSADFLLRFFNLSAIDYEHSIL